MPDRPNCLSPDACQAKGPRHCRQCACIAMNADPIRAAQVSADMKARLSDPEYKARHLAGLKRCWNDPANVEKRREAGRIYGPANILATRTPEARAKAGRAISRTKMGWCPLDLRPLYTKLRNSFGAAKARNMIEEQMRVDARRATAAWLKSIERLAA